MDRDFLLAARETYLRVNEAALAWMLDRPRLRGAFLNTKRNSITLRDYGAGDGWRGPDMLYGWIQGRGLEALVTQARFFERERPAFATRLREAALPLYRALADLHARHDRAFFAYDADLRPVHPGEDGEALPQRADEGLFTYSDIFVLKGLIAASRSFEPTATGRYLQGLAAVVDAVEAGRFVIDERRPLDRDALRLQAEEYGPRMILLSAATMLHDLGLPEAAAFGPRFVAQILERHVEDGRGDLPAGTTRDVPGGDHCNPGHAIEFAGFALDLLPSGADPDLVRRLEQILLVSFALGFAPPGIRLGVSLAGGEPSAVRPWWSLPETIRAAAKAHEHTGHAASATVWRTAHDAFFRHYWRGDPPLAYQTLADAGPVDFVPATPDLDPGYHTGLSLLGAIRAIDRLRPTTP